MSDKVAKVHSGVIGWYWPGTRQAKSLNREPERGYLKLGDNGLLELVALDESDVLKLHLGAPTRPSVITGATDAGGIMLLDIAGTGRTANFGGSAASIMRYRARTLVTGLDISKVRNSKLRSLSAHYFGISSWFNISATKEEWHHHPGSARLKAFSLSVDTIDNQSATLPNGRKLTVTAYWRISGPSDQRSIHAPISMGCSAQRAKSIQQLRQPLLRAQDLISLAFGGHVTAANGQAVPDLKDGSQPDVTPAAWDYHLMARAPGVQPVKEKDLPYFYCVDIGGPAGVARWIALCQNHPRAIRPLVERFRLGKPSAPLRLMEVAAGMEYWVNVNRGARVWARVRCPQRRHGCGFAWPIASYVGPDFADWCGGDSHAWAQRFWSTYNKLKHDPAAVDEYEISLLADTGHLLLTAAILRRIAGSRKPAKRIFEGSSHRTWQLRSEIHKLLP
ncbi:hypothetical protein [Micromonospora haikouensis]|uniref:ApeA N-terminal domain 1-containing protein n=1 Tax=Micromonospora haikouensis TaxID=686309 RepID=UPI003D91E785